MTIGDRYLGDGVYAADDGIGITLDLRGQDNTTRIALDPEVLVALDRFKVDLVAEQKRERGCPPTPNP